MPSPMVTAISLDSHECTVHVDETWPLRVSFAPAGSSSRVEWFSSNEEVATVSSTGKVTGISPGKATIFVHALRNIEADDECVVTVIPPKEPDILVSTIRFSESKFEIEKGATLDLRGYVSVLPDNAANRTLVWSSSDLAVAVVSAGVVTARGSGTAVIKAMATDGSGVFANCTVKVKDDGNVTPPDPGADPPTEPGLVLFDACDNLDYFTGNEKHRTGVTVEKVGRQQGSGYIQRVSGSDAEIFIFGRGSAGIDAKVTDYSKAQLVFWFYVEDASKLRSKTVSGGRIEISHSGSPSRQALWWDSKAYVSDKVIDGWNYIVLPFSEGKEITPESRFSPKSANYFRIYFDGPIASTEMTYGIDAIGFKQPD